MGHTRVLGQGRAGGCSERVHALRRRRRIYGTASSVVVHEDLLSRNKAKGTARGTPGLARRPCSTIGPQCAMQGPRRSQHRSSVQVVGDRVHARGRRTSVPYTLASCSSSQPGWAPCGLQRLGASRMGDSRVSGVMLTDSVGQGREVAGGVSTHVDAPSIDPTPAVAPSLFQPRWSGARARQPSMRASQHPLANGRPSGSGQYSDPGRPWHHSPLRPKLAATGPSALAAPSASIAAQSTVYAIGCRVSRAATPSAMRHASCKSQPERRGGAPLTERTPRKAHPVILRSH